MRDLAKLVTGAQVNTSKTFGNFQALPKLTYGTTLKAKEISLNFSITLWWKPFFAEELWFFS
jgi:hypothetical protein